ncbi:MAG: hypothetical protein AVDCRST_MAG08-1195, partial [uncultured Acetobacteraceae bacterium]
RAQGHLHHAAAHARGAGAGDPLPAGGAVPAEPRFSRIPGI